jgi:hypothetical protein
MRVILRELAHAHQSVERAVRLVPVAATILVQPDRQFAIAGDTLLEDQHMRRSILWLDRHHIGVR